METGLTDFFWFALVAIAIGVLVVFRLYGEVANKIDHRWVIMTALGAGVIAFSFKVLAVVTLSSLPPQIERMPNTTSAKTVYDKLYQSVVTQHSSDLAPAYQWQALPNQATAPADNPITPEKVALGKKLFFDKRLSIDGSTSCASCHQLDSDKGGADGKAIAIGFQNKLGTRNSPTVFNAAFQTKFFWDGRAHSLEEQAAGPIFNPVEMGMTSETKLVQKLEKVAVYLVMFQQAFGSPEISLERITQAIASYERTLITPNSAYDRYVQGDESALNLAQKRGMVLFEQTGCVFCHSGANFSGASYLSDTGRETFVFPAMNGEMEDLVSFELLEDKGALLQLGTEMETKQAIWRVPSLRNVTLTAPYFHNGSVETLEEAVSIMARAQLDRSVSEEFEKDLHADWIPQRQQYITRQNQNLTEQQIADIVAFLGALEGEIDGNF